ncbi:uncharacterized protein METZ01_LOCUS115179 [marine metagenome]|uniref:Capsule assembly Wzi family protein n=1 Tax=marine metagenome TaxID=408172 RepID=A0A381XC59_9ZZZZ
MRSSAVRLILLRGLLFLPPTLCGPASAWAQDPGRIGSRILSMDSWTYEPIERLRSRAYLSGLNPMVQPYRRIDVAAELISLEPDTLREPVAGWVRMLTRELAPELERLSPSEDEESEDEVVGQRVGLQFLLGSISADSRRRDPLIPFRSSNDEGLKDRTWRSGAGGLWLEAYNVAAETRLYWTNWYARKHGDPDGQSPGGFKSIGRTDNAYLTLAFPWGNVWVGRFKRNWGPIGQTGLMIGDNPTTYPQIGLDLGRGSLTFRFMAGELLSEEGRQRFIVSNRLDYHRGNSWVSIGQAALYSGEPAVLRLFNPLEAIFFDRSSNYDRDVISSNMMLNAMFWTRVGQGTLYGEFVLDDFDLNPRVGAVDRGVFPTIYHLSLGGRYLGVSDRVEFGFDYRRVSAWSYRTSDNKPEVWMHFDRGLGDPWSDYDRLTLRADLYPSVAGLRISPVLQFQRKGEGDYRLPFQGRRTDLPGIFIGVMETTKRVAVQGRYQPLKQVFLEWDLGRSFISNAGHIDGSSEGRFSFLFRLGVTLELGLGTL